mmetsp:Transcript_1431/g.4304  ORF Transcript_1431/g.4304 Transcript_1431/m.4304 type:complete len:98 (+) Transcript_1431:1-294(+)
MFYGESQQQPVQVAIAPGEAGMVSVTVRDHGPGVPEAALARLGQPYTRLDHGAAMRKEGQGLGLSIVREIVADHGGSVRFRNHPEGGFEVRLALPAG